MDLNKVIEEIDLPFQTTWKGEINEVFCTNCLRAEYFFTGGQSSSPDLCPCGCEDTIHWRDMDTIRRYKAIIKNAELYRDKIKSSKY